MVTVARWKRLAILATLSASALFLSGCALIDPEEDRSGTVAGMRISIHGCCVLTIDRAGKITGDQVVEVFTGGVLSASFVDDAGAQVSRLVGYALRVTPLDPRLVTFDMHGNRFSGTFTYAGDGSVMHHTSLGLELYHQASGRVAFGPVNVDARVHGPPGEEDPAAGRR